ncbi:hypothetical protein G6O69_23285 [Pseudenhygromyxa sp. WMMC2535]|uniref:hypothetical protein n=1 Tax=Pseudenhygromyxa sp. WMMC2535 TaxID=2712867 RepID=UPI001552D5B2|nr:hypothetical protein [Pseudenhygromyxa sp. WMMC2535]NVB40783.1 hypothetical protein [Pseudenhygromyxa sp. WMMC2535]
MKTLRLGPALATFAALAPLLLGACVKWQREPDFYADTLTDLLESRSDAVAACYDGYLEAVDPAAQGALTVSFEVERNTGALTGITVDAGATEVPEALAACVTEELASLTLSPPDVNTADARFTWVFALGSAKKPPADPFAGAQDALLACYGEHLAQVDREASGDLVIDYAFDPETGALREFAVVADATTAPQAVVDCAKDSLAAAKLDPDKLDARNTAGRRTFELRYTPYTEE